MRQVTIIALVGILVVAVTTTVLAGLFDFNKTLEGVIKDISANTIVVTAEDPDGSSIADLSFETNEKTVLKEIESLESLKEGDKVTIEYTENNDQKIATLIAKVVEQPQASAVKAMNL